MADNNYDTPNNSEPVVDENGMVTLSWNQWISRTHRAAFSVQQSGATPERPASVLWIGRFFFDTTLNKPIWIKQVKPVVLWCDATGATV